MTLTRGSGFDDALRVLSAGQQLSGCNQMGGYGDARARELVKALPGALGA
jgi:hypothetical protein